MTSPSEWSVKPIVDPGSATAIAHLERAGSTGVRAIWCSKEEVVVRVLIAREPWPPQLGVTDWRWHISAAVVAPEPRVPSWAELVGLAHQLRPGVGFVISVPPRSLWMNVHSDVLHLTESRDEGLWAEWRANALGHDPS